MLLARGTWGAEDAPSAPFQPAEISIGEPLQLPPKPAPDATGAPAEPSPPGGNGWIGLTADDKVVTGRLVVVDVAAAGPADRGGIKTRDQLLAIDGVPLQTADQLAAALAAIAPGSAVKVAVGRGDRIDEVVLKATARPVKPPSPEWQPADAAAPPVAQQPVQARDAMPTPGKIPRKPPTFEPTPTVPTPGPVASRAADGPARGRTALGVRTMPVDPTAQARFHLAEPAGALVIGVVHDLPASKAGVPPGSVIVALDNQPVRSPDELTQIVTAGPVGRPVTLQYILPGGEERRAEVSLQSLEVPLERVLVGPP